MNSGTVPGANGRGLVGADPLVEYAREVLAQAAAVDGSAVRRGRYRLPFVDVDARFTDPDYALHCERSFAAWPASDTAAECVEIVVADASTSGISPPRAWWEAYYRPLEIERRLAVAGLRGTYFHDNQIWHFYDPEARFGVSLLAAPGDYPPWETSAPLRALLHWIYAERGLRLVHAATLGRNGRGVMIAGHGGAGKSSTTLAGVIAGLDSAGDDYVLVDPGAPPTAYPLFRNMKQDAPGYARLRLARFLGDPGPVNWQGKHEFDFERLGGGKRTASLAMEAILIPRLSDNRRTTIRPVKPREAMLALSPSGIFQLPGERASGVRLFADLVRRLPSFSVELSEEPDEIGERLVAFVDGARD